MEKSLPCPECGGLMILKESEYGKFYGCAQWPDCDCTHGAHPNGEPLGVPANKETRLARMAAHEAFDLMRVATGFKRSKAYAWMRWRMRMSNDDCHIGKFDVPTCEKVIQVCEEEAARVGFGDPWAKNPAKPR